jgi:hypothetical protein
MGTDVLQRSDWRLDVLHGSRKVVIRLQRYPESGRADPGLLQHDRQIRADAGAAVQNARKRGCRSNPRNFCPPRFASQSQNSAFEKAIVADFHEKDAW